MALSPIKILHAGDCCGGRYKAGVVVTFVNLLVDGTGFLYVSIGFIKLTSHPKGYNIENLGPGVKC